MNDTMEAWRATMPAIDMYACWAAVVASIPRDMNHAVALFIICVAASLAWVTLAPSTLKFDCDRRATTVVTMAMPMLAPMLRIRLKMLVALPICSLEMVPCVMVVS